MCLSLALLHDAGPSTSFILPRSPKAQRGGASEGLCSLQHFPPTEAEIAAFQKGEDVISLGRATKAHQASSRAKCKGAPGAAHFTAAQIQVSLKPKTPPADPSTLRMQDRLSPVLDGLTAHAFMSSCALRRCDGRPVLHHHPTDDKYGYPCFICCPCQEQYICSNGHEDASVILLGGRYWPLARRTEPGHSCMVLCHCTALARSTAAVSQVPGSPVKRLRYGGAGTAGVPRRCAEPV